METQLLIKIIHMSSVALAMLVFVLRAATLFIGTVNQQPNPKGRVVFVAMQHLSYTVLVLTGVVLLIMKDFQVQPWFYAKIILFLVLLSTQIKAYKRDESITLQQRQAGVAIGAMVFLAILILVMIKPTF
ncbi:SirB2 family protein [Acinetobacter rudis]|uniref:SirB2 family protein n=1 Tax=Acinetobacter rudis TaxID=632955 RepID=A0AAW8JAN3_9GAMM|nr:SirB2 family protein [Acinetobacter rudis]MDQ8936254.1 SirB2 family protein [Acinetobacter rudis]MDQ8953968.1 SirB2 family protein [Acinetobacter rudis]MDQ9018517.1 SirB2 family protein [Acinetobacter rudis]